MRMIIQDTSLHKDDEMSVRFLYIYTTSSLL